MQAGSSRLASDSVVADMVAEARTAAADPEEVPPQDLGRGKRRCTRGDPDPPQNASLAKRRYSSYRNKSSLVNALGCPHLIWPVSSLREKSSAIYTCAASRLPALALLHIWSLAYRLQIRNSALLPHA